MEKYAVVETPAEKEAQEKYAKQVQEKTKPKAKKKPVKE